MPGRGNNYFKKEDTAFTLIELLIGVFVFAMIAAAVCSTFHAGIKLYTITQRNIRINQKINRVLDRLSLELRNCYGAEYIQDSERISFIGGCNSISFFTLKGVHQKDYSGKIPARITYSFRDAGLFKKIQRGMDIFSDSRGFEDKEMILGIKGVNFKYLYSKPEQDKYEWLSDWPDKSVIPRGIVIEVNLDGLEPIKRYVYISQGEPARK